MNNFWVRDDPIEELTQEQLTAVAVIIPDNEQELLNYEFTEALNTILNVSVHLPLIGPCIEVLRDVVQNCILAQENQLVLEEFSTNLQMIGGILYEFQHLPRSAAAFALLGRVKNLLDSANLFVNRVSRKSFGNICRTVFKAKSVRDKLVRYEENLSRLVSYLSMCVTFEVLGEVQSN